MLLHKRKTTASVRRLRACSRLLIILPPPQMARLPRAKIRDRASKGKARVRGKDKIRDKGKARVRDRARGKARDKGKAKAREGKGRVAQGAIMEQEISRGKMIRSTFLDR